MIALRPNYGIVKHTTQIEYKTATLRRDDIYRAYIDILAKLIDEGQAHLHIRFTPTINQKDTNEAISKAFYSLMLYRAGRYYGKDCKISYRPDNGCCTAYLPTMASGLNSQIRAQFNVHHDAVSSIQPTDSSKEHLLQLLDVSLGALTAYRNGYHEDDNRNQYKRDLMAYAVEKLNVVVTENSNIIKRTKNIWNVIPNNTRLNSTS